MPAILMGKQTLIDDGKIMKDWSCCDFFASFFTKNCFEIMTVQFFHMPSP